MRRNGFEPALPGRPAPVPAGGWLPGHARPKVTWRQRPPRFPAPAPFRLNSTGSGITGVRRPHDRAH